MVWHWQLGGGSLAAAAWQRRGSGGSALVALSTKTVTAWRRSSGGVWRLRGGGSGSGSLAAAAWQRQLGVAAVAAWRRWQRSSGNSIGGGRVVAAHSVMTAAAWRW